MKKQKTIPQLKKACQDVFNKYIRLRDKDKPCISCGQFKTLQAGHYFPVQGFDGLRYDENNANGECEYDNCFNEAHLIGYGINLKARIGEERYNALLERAAKYKRDGYKFSKSEIMELITLYRNKIADLENNS
jgi:hypothetical protein